MENNNEEDEEIQRQSNELLIGIEDDDDEEETGIEKIIKILIFIFIVIWFGWMLTNAFN